MPFLEYRQDLCYDLEECKMQEKRAAAVFFMEELEMARYDFRYRSDETGITEDMPDRRSAVKDWRGLFSDSMLNWAGKAAAQGAVFRFKEYGWRCEAAVQDEGKRQVVISHPPVKFMDEWENTSFECTCPDARRTGRCRHMAAVMLCWEKEHGPWTVWESREEYRVRKRKEAWEREKARRKSLFEELGDAPVPAARFFTGRNPGPGPVIFDLAAAIGECVTTPYALARGEEIAAENLLGYRNVSTERMPGGEQCLRIICTFEDMAGYVPVRGRIIANRIVELESAKPGRYLMPDTKTEAAVFDPAVPLNGYQLAALGAAWDYLDNNPQMNRLTTDGNARRFFTAVEQAKREGARRAAENQSRKPAEKKKEVTVFPRIIVDSGQAKLSFKAGRAGGRMYILRNLREFSECCLEEKCFALSKKEILDFSVQDFTEDSLPLMQFITRRVGEIGDANEQLMDRGRYYGRTGMLSVGSSMDLRGNLLDTFYDISVGKHFEFQDKGSGMTQDEVPVGHRDMRFTLQMEDVFDARGSFAGVTVRGRIPVQINGNTGNYILNEKGLSRISREEEQVLSPFQEVADASGRFRFIVGRDSLQEYFYRVLPLLTDNPCVFLEDHTSGMAGRYLPPEPAFTFYLDFEESWLLIHTRVTYGEKEYILDPEDLPAAGNTEEEPGDASPAWSGYRDVRQEQRVLDLLGEMFEYWDHASQQYCVLTDDRRLYAFLTEDTERLAQFGDLKGTEAFRRLNVRPAPAVSVGVRVECGLMDLSVFSKDLTPEELVSVLDSYRRKKRYHKLNAGTFIDLTRENQLQELDALLSALDMNESDLMTGKMQLPLYRALYLDRLMEEHDALTAARDRTYRALVRSFKTVRDAEYEVPAALEDALRPYQSYGFKWMKTIQAAGFGGILADEMGLGKTLQTIAVFLSDRENGSEKPSLVICPASLVYNWEEELRRFAPDLKCMVMSGSSPARKKRLKEVQEGGTDVCVVSYDTLKRDIAWYRDIVFCNCVLDEAQYIKNPGAAVSKAVKAVRSLHRFALTGTPIENRLSELWSIFDFLMPGFLYSMSDFSSRFETHIVREKDEAVTEKLKQMVHPFVLRRCKADVLKDLPAKLEEVRYARVEGEQQRVYDAQVVRMKQMLTDPQLDRSGEGRIRILAELTRIRQICCDPSLLFDNYHGESAKREAALELIRSAMDGGHRMLVFSQFTSMLSLLEEDLKREKIPYYMITGSTPKEKRMSLVHAFNEGDVPVFLISLKAGGYGLNLTGADVVIHYDPWWNLSAQNQATDRAHRIGQTRQVMVYRLILKDTIEERILDLQNAKKDLADAILEGRRESIMSMSSEELLALLG